MVNRSKVVFPSKAYTATQQARVTNPEGRNLVLIIDATAEVATASVVFKIQGLDEASGKKWDILESAAVTGVETRILRVGPDLTAAANLVAKDIVPYVFIVTATHADADALTYSVAAQLVA